MGRWGAEGEMGRGWGEGEMGNFRLSLINYKIEMLPSRARNDKISFLGGKDAISFSNGDRPILSFCGLFGEGFSL